jgi:hypothetical protein
MEIEIDSRSVVLRLTYDESASLGVALLEGCISVSRAEYYIRTGLSAPDVDRIATVLKSPGDSGVGKQIVPLEIGVEEVENPRRPRPRPTVNEVPPESW